MKELAIDKLELLINDLKINKNNLTKIKIYDIIFIEIKGKEN